MPAIYGDILLAEIKFSTGRKYSLTSLLCKQIKVTDFKFIIYKYIRIQYYSLCICWNQISRLYPIYKRWIYSFYLLWKFSLSNAKCFYSVLKNPCVVICKNRKGHDLVSFWAIFCKIFTKCVFNVVSSFLSFGEVAGHLFLIFMLKIFLTSYFVSKKNQKCPELAWHRERTDCVRRGQLFVVVCLCASICPQFKKFI